MRLFRVIAAATTAMLLAGCGGGISPPVEELVGSGTVAPPSVAERTTAAAVRPADVRANELGVVPVLMYHRIVAKPTSVYDRKPEDFRAELERLAREDYVPVTTAEFVRGEIDIPAGKHPVVLTFDDGDPSAFSLGPDGEPEQGTAVRILLQVAEAHPGFRPVASLYVNAEPFGGGTKGQRALTWLHGHDFEIGNHTYGHTNLGSAADSEAQQDIARGDEAIRKALPGYRPTTLALPFGARSDTKGLVLRGPGYDYAGALLVGANPAPSPYSVDFDPEAVPRIRSQGADGAEAKYGSTVWLDELEADPDIRYTSDGDPETISYPAGTGSPAERFAARAVAY
ncbi:Peptidoglycan/xylan/chitin deacetylase, PgdA/CDA1 family [Amycolatopsis marina]|uniref:Peptidoglycan/xylan/chitin deacetylase, PgdA/CDA1 family n=1 Tax=Amycolatopsis marina TaxID=490629 RepID=A0A1I1CB35_9PSEU|nr:Peptidoglycan/xylan/chitin deacetylase, PgdA/CDA1 family [Amycolatopsis marina]